jgi:D-beta-D-heptose 7-phosphate kinase/D-beta-D-heptose 1-phosphate adenosyltransferase
VTGSTAAKVRDLAAAVAWRARAAAPVVFTNGVFDLVHPGHVRVLEAARALGGSLVVGVNTDASARGLGKGPARPVADAESRARVLAAFACVDCVVLFGEPTPLALITALQPDVLVKGGDYDPDTVVGADVVRARGGHVAIIPLVPDQSTTRLVERLRVSS